MRKNEPSEDKRLFKNPQLTVAWGELIDKITILEIKAEMLSEPTALANVKTELDYISPAAEAVLLSVEGLAELKEQLYQINLRLWKIEDDIRDKERRKEFDEEFIEFARSVYFENDERAQIKKKINMMLMSDIHEEKSYKPY